jgi:hypothetical protein
MCRSSGVIVAGKNRLTGTGSGGPGLRKSKELFAKKKLQRWLVTVDYADGERAGRVYTDREKAARFAEKKKKSASVKRTRVAKVE